MCAVQGALSAAERSMRSVFVGNIPYEATEEQLKDIFSEVGPVVSFRLVYDRETGKPKGYGFCEYKDQETALSAMRNLNGHELNGRALRVDNAASEKSKEELKNLQASLGGPPVESPYGPEVDPEKVPESIAKVVASLPPEQLYDLIKQMKTCIQNNPNEARNLLLQNPQLSYALLQALVVMRIVEPQVAVSMLHRQNPNASAALLPTPSDIETKPTAVPNSISVNSLSNQPPALTTPAVPYSSPQINPSLNDMPPNAIPPSVMFPGVHTSPSKPPSMSNSVMSTGTRSSVIPPSRPSLLGDRPPAPVLPADAVPRPAVAPNGPYPDRGMDNFEPYAGPRPLGDRDMRSHLRGDHDMRQPPGMMSDQDMRQAMTDQDLRMMHGSGMMDGRPPYDPRFRTMAPNEPAGRSPLGMPPCEQRAGPPGPPYDSRNTFDGRSSGVPPVRIEDPRNMNAAVPPPRVPQTVPRSGASVTASESPIVPQSSPSAAASPRPSSASLAAAAAAIAPHDQEKAALIMQVLQLSDQQIAMLPSEQRHSIMILKEQIARSCPR